MKHSKKSSHGFTLMEMLIVVAIIAVLVAIAIPVVSHSLHKSREAADLANIRSYYAYLQADYLQTGTYLPGIQDDWYAALTDKIVYPDGKTIKLQTGLMSVIRPTINQPSAWEGYQIHYVCNNGDLVYSFGASDQTGS